MLIDRRISAVALMFMLCVCLPSALLAQTDACPSNLGFESGSFANWECYRGTATTNGSVNVLTLTSSAPTADVHTIYKKSSNPGNDPFGGFPKICPDGGFYSVKLGNSITGAQAERISYTFTVPANRPDFTITYYYAVVFEDPSHPEAQQPRFTAKVFDVAANKYVDCGSFNYVATAKLPGFKKSTLSTTVYYKSWTPVTINLSQYSGKVIRLEFSTADCTVSGHFGYAYVDVEENCSTPVRGSNYCGSPPSITLKGPSGYEKYNWYNGDLTQLLGTGETLTLSPAPADGTKISLQVIPYVGFGCLEVIQTVIRLVDMQFAVFNPPAVCTGTIDLTDPSITSGSEPGLIFTYWKDPGASIPLANPASVTVSGTYYIKAVSSGGCSKVKPVTVKVLPAIVLLTNPIIACLPAPANLTAAAVTAGSDPGLSFTYWADANTTIPLANPASITSSGTFYIKAANSEGCTATKTVTVTVNPLVNLRVNNPAPLCEGTTVSITGTAVTAGSETGLTLSYWSDVNGTVALPNPTAIALPGTYYIKAVNLKGCTIIKPVLVSFVALPKIAVTDPAPVCEGNLIDITAAPVVLRNEPGLIISYWKDAGTSLSLPDPAKIAASGTYYIKAGTIRGCYITLPVHVAINPLPKLVVTDPAAVCAPGIVDITAASVSNAGGLDAKISYWEDAGATIPLKQPHKIARSGTYYIKAQSTPGCITMLPVRVTVNPLPVFTVSAPKPVYEPQEIDLTACKSTADQLVFSYSYTATGTGPIPDPAHITKSGTYFITGTTGAGCSLTYPVEVVIAQQPKAYVPTGFTPLRPTNNKLSPFLVGVKSLVSFKVYNKLGNVVYQTSDVHAGWDGYQQSSLLAFDTYTWYVEGYDELGNHFKQSGNTVLVR